MLALDLAKRAQKFLRSLLPKHERQVVKKIIELRFNPHPPDSKQLKDSAYRGVDTGEYRIIYIVRGGTLYIPIVGKRNDDAVYKLLKQWEG